MPFASLVYFFLQKGKSSLQQELDNFLSSKISSYTKYALRQQKSKLKHEVFEDINTLQLEHFYDNSPDVKKWKGYR